MRRYRESHRRREPLIPTPCVDVGAVREPPEGHATPNVTPTNDNCPLRHRPASPYIGCMRHSRAERPSFPRSREPRTLPHADPLALWERVRVRVRGRECNEMQSNATELKVSPLLATPDEANQGHNQGRLAHRIRVSGVPNEATVASFSASPLGVNEANQGQMGPKIKPQLHLVASVQAPSSLRRWHHPLALWERVRVRVR